jgi:hypothetical protein
LQFVFDKDLMERSFIPRMHTLFQRAFGRGALRPGGISERLVGPYLSESISKRWPTRQESSAEGVTRLPSSRQSIPVLAARRPLFPF